MKTQTMKKRKKMLRKIQMKPFLIRRKLIKQITNHKMYITNMMKSY